MCICREGSFTEEDAIAVGVAAGKELKEQAGDDFFDWARQMYTDNYAVSLWCRVQLSQTRSVLQFRHLVIYFIRLLQCSL